MEMSRIFDPSAAINHAPGEVDIHFIPFRSSSGEETAEVRSLHLIRNEVTGGLADEMIRENREFSYPVFTPAGMQKNKGAILLLHGLNERRYDKYYTWAHRLVRDTGKSVILFPISFHLNRGLASWTDRHLMTEMAERRKQIFHTGDETYTFINQALSIRLTESPERFFTSGLQTCNDIISVLRQVKDGDHPLFTRDSYADIFAYSIGGLLAQVLYISNPDNLFSDSRLFLFCAGSLFGDMNGISKVIMDPPAYERIHKYYTDELENKIRKSGVFADFFNNSKIGMAFRSMITPDRFSSVRERVFKNRSRQIFALSLKDDKVIPPDKVSTALGEDNRNMEVLDFDYPYCHEMPFPFKLEKFKDKINEAFERVFLKAGVFLS